ncbi:MAG: site-specific integrase [Nitrospina sp.]|nr:site-specific integrase [Nitrospina sp.]
MAIKFSKLTRPSIRSLKASQKISENGITFERLANGDGRYSVNIMVDGQRIHRTIGKESEGVTRKQVEDFIEQVKTESRTGRLNLPEGRKLTLGFKEAAFAYLKRLPEEGGKDLKAKTMRLNQHLTPFYKSKPLSGIYTFDVERYKKHRLDYKAAPGTVNRELAVLSHLFSKAVEWKWLTHKPAKINRLREDAGRIVYLDSEQASRLLEAAKKDQSPYIYPFIVVGLATGMRRMEILSIRMKDIHLNRGLIYIPNSKTGSREQPITNHLREFLGEVINASGSERKWLFPSDKSKTGHVVAIEKAFRRTVERAGLDSREVVRHTLRHTAVSHLVQAGVDLPTVKKISGHKTLAMVERYSHQNGEHIQAAMDKLEGRYNSSGKGFLGSITQELHIKRKRA